MQNKCQNARETYEAVAQSENVPNDVKSNVYKQLGKSDIILNTGSDLKADFHSAQFSERAKFWDRFLLKCVLSCTVERISLVWWLTAHIPRKVPRAC